MKNTFLSEKHSENSNLLRECSLGFFILFKEYFCIFLYIHFAFFVFQEVCSANTFFEDITYVGVNLKERQALNVT